MAAPLDYPGIDATEARRLRPDDPIEGAYHQGWRDGYRSCWKRDAEPRIRALKMTAMALWAVIASLVAVLSFVVHKL